MTAADQPTATPDECACGCPEDAHIGEIGCPCGPPDEPPCAASEGCDCTELCSMGPTCPGGMLARLTRSGCSRSRPIEQEFAVVIAALLAGRVDGQQAVASLTAIHHRERSAT